MTRQRACNTEDVPLANTDFSVNYNQRDTSWAEWIAGQVRGEAEHDEDSSMGLQVRKQFRGRNAAGLSQATGRQNRRSAGGK